MHTYGFLLAKQYKKELGRIAKDTPALAFYDDWEPLWFGPFSSGLTHDIADCVKRGTILKEPMIPSIVSSPDPHMFSLTSNGRVKLHEVGP